MSDPQYALSGAALTAAELDQLDRAIENGFLVTHASCPALIEAWRELAYRQSPMAIRVRLRDEWHIDNATNQASFGWADLLISFRDGFELTPEAFRRTRSMILEHGPRKHIIAPNYVRVLGLPKTATLMLAERIAGYGVAQQ